MEHRYPVVSSNKSFRIVQYSTVLYSDDLNTNIRVCLHVNLFNRDPSFALLESFVKRKKIVFEEFELLLPLIPINF